MWKVAIEDDQSNQTVVDLVRDDYSIGRDPANTVRLTERNISRKHALLKRSGDGWVIRDLSSYNGCFINGSRVSSEEPVKHGDLIQLGDYRLELLSETSESRPDRENKSATLPGRQSQTIRELPIRLVMIAGPVVGASFPVLGKRILIGRGEDCDLPINDTSVSRVHAEIHLLDGGQYEVVDHDSSNGVRVNGVELKRSILDAGDVIEFGDVQLKFVPAGQVFHAQDAVASRRNSLEPGVDDHPAAGGSRSRWIAVAGALAVAGVLAFVALRGTAESPVQAEQVEANPAAQAFDEARSLLAAGDVEGALRKAQEVPDDSNLRESTVFKEIQAKWAATVFEQAAGEADRTRKRALLDLIAKSPDVGSILRKRAANEIAELDADSVGIDELPSAGRPPEQKSSPEKRAATASGSVGPAAAPAASPPKKKPEAKSGFVRETPF